MNSICKFIPAKKDGGVLKTVHFVYETEFKKMKQPFMHPIYYLYLVTKGSAALKIGGREYLLGVGSIFYAFPATEYQIIGSDDFTYMYISFMGNRGAELAESLNISLENCVFGGFEEEIAFWKRSISEITTSNANMLTESVLLHTLSMLFSINDNQGKTMGNNQLDRILVFLDNNYFNPDINLKRVADIFGYTEKYFSHLFKSEFNINFTQFLTELRIQKAVDKIEKGEVRVFELAKSCGFTDSGYFSKVFKRLVGETPNEYIKTKK